LLGGLWADADGDTAERRASTARRCASVVRIVSGQDDPVKVESLKMLDPSMTDPLVAKVTDLAKTDGLDESHAASIEKLAKALVAAAREATTARRAAAKVRGDIEKLRSDREKAAARDRDADRLSAEPELATDAHAIGTLLALSRVRAAQDLPKHMKLYAVAPAFAAVFGVAPPPLPERAKDRLKPGSFLAYVTSVASACGHPVDASVKKPKEKEALAWKGVLAGFADRLEADAPQLKDEGLRDAVKAAISQLEAPK
jgi:hypothetical protein